VLSVALCAGGPATQMVGQAPGLRISSMTREGRRNSQSARGTRSSPVMLALASSVC